MKRLSGFVLLLIAAGCSGVSTGQRSDCFGRTDVENTFVTRDGTTVSLQGALSAVAPVDDCVFEDF